jgi:Dna[CI] antecedent, DciA
MRPNPRTARTVIDFLNRHDTAAALVPAAQRALDLKKDLLMLLPTALREGCEAAGCDDGVLNLRVASASAAAKLRQTLPRIQSGLVDRGWEVSAIRIRIQPPDPALLTGSRTPHGRGTDLSAHGVDAFAGLHGTLDESPLRDAVERLVRRRRS